MNFNTNTINKAKKGATILLMTAVLASGVLDLLLPRTSQADIMQEASVSTGSLGVLPSSQNNTLLPIITTQKADATGTQSVMMKITAYSSEESQTDSTPLVTASGKHVADGIVANNLLPFGAKVRIPTLYGDKVFVVQDRMNKKKSDYHLDIWMPDTKQAMNFGSQIAYVEILSK
jgi:3D (Asp-Asp-Asp) domain-containing protein